MTLTPQERAERAAGLGGSDALAYCGKDPNKTPLELYLEKTATGSPPEPVPVVEDAPVDPRRDWGNRLEPVVRDWLSEELGRRIFTSNRLYRSTDFPFMIGHLDGVTQAPLEGIEIKTADKFMAQEFGEVETDQVPVRYVLQVTHYMLVTGIKRFHLGALVGGNDARHYVIDYDFELASMLADRARAFWQHVETHTPPDPVTLADAGRRWPKSLGQAIVANEAIAHAVGELKAMRAAEAETAAKADAIELTLKAFMGEADVLTDGHKKVLASWRSQTRERFDQKTFAEAHPDLIAQYRATSSFRVFRLK